MRKFLDKFYQLTEKIGKQNVILLLFVFLIVIVTSFYQTFSLFTSSDGVSLIDGIKTFKFILNEDSEETNVIVAAGASKNIAITVSNQDEIDLKYGIYYSSNDDLTNVDLGYLYDSEYLPNGIIPSGEDYIVTIKIDNNSENNVTITFGTLYGTENGGELELKSNQNFLDIKYLFCLNEVEPGRYVKYIGNNGCMGASCEGQNANYIDDDNMGYCSDENYKFQVNGWRIAYIKNDVPYLISAGATECMCTNSDGTTSNSSCSSNEDITMEVVYHINNLNNSVLKYCNLGYSSYNICDINTIWSMKEDDFTQITSNNFDVCLNLPSKKECGSSNSLIDIGSYYWYANSKFLSSQYYIYGWFAYYHTVGYNFVGGWNSNKVNGNRPVIKLDEDIVVLSGTGTYKDPYIIDNPNTVRDLSGNMNNGVPKNGLSWDQENGSIRTDGVASFLHAGLKNYDFGSNVSFVIRMKFNQLPSENSTYYEFFGNWESGGLGFGIGGNNTPYFTAYLNSEYPRAAAEQPLEKNKWYTLVGTYNGSELILYIDGVKQTPTAATGNIGISSAPMAIGGNPRASTDDIIDYLTPADYSDALIFTRTLTEEEIVNNYSNIPNPTNKEGLLLHYDFKNYSSDMSSSTITYMKSFSGSDDKSYFHDDTYREKIKSISFVSDINTTNSVASWDMSKRNDSSVLAWVTNHEESGYYHLYIGSEKEIHAKNLSYFFYGMTNVDEISFDNLYTSNTTNMFSMFESMGENSTVLTLDLGDHFDTSKVTNMERMFYKTGKSSTVFTLDLGDKFDTSNVVGSMYAMFCETGRSSTVFTLDLGDKFDTSGVTAMNWMFGYAGYDSTVFTLNLGDKFDTSNVSNMTWMFSYLGYNTSNFTLNLVNKFNTSKVTTMGAMFFQVGYNSTAFSISFGDKFSTSNVASMGWMFSGIGKATTNLELDLSSFDFTNVTIYDGMFDEFTTDKKIYVLNSTQQSWIVDKGFGNGNVTSSNVLIKS